VDQARARWQSLSYISLRANRRERLVRDLAANKEAVISRPLTTLNSGEILIDTTIKDISIYNLLRLWFDFSNLRRGFNVSKDLEEVTRLINLYIEGAGKGNADKLNEAFHSSARWFGTMGGVDYDVDKAGFVALMVESPGDAGQMKATITDIQIDGTVAVATVKEEGFWGTLSFTNYFTLSVLDGRWQITNKTFAHTGGEHA
jgi:hypothetical protein